MERNRDESERLRLEYERFKADAEEKLRRKLEESEKQILREREQARRMIDSARINSEYVFKELSEIRKKQERSDFAKQLGEARERVREALKQSDHVYDAYAPNISLEEEYVLPRPLVVGDAVYIVPYHQEGVVTATAGADGFVAVRAGILKAKIAEKDLRLITEQMKKKVPERKAKPSEAKIKKSVIGDFKAELDIRGRYGDDGWEETDKYLDSAVLAGLTVARIVHGKGTGALKKAIWERLKGDPRVKSFRLGNYGEGDSGVTVVELK
jgi:DNA mismatch repair protein MutS2